MIQLSSYTMYLSLPFTRDIICTPRTCLCKFPSQFEYVASYNFGEKFTINFLKVTTIIEKVITFLISYPAVKKKKKIFLVLLLHSFSFQLASLKQATPLLLFTLQLMLLLLCPLIFLLQ